MVMCLCVSLFCLNIGNNTHNCARKVSFVKKVSLTRVWMCFFTIFAEYEKSGAITDGGFDLHILY